jgi:hypothetical protein
MANESYFQEGINPNLFNLKGFISGNNHFSLTSKSLASWSFDGDIPNDMGYVEIWNKDLGKFNVKPGDYIVITDDPENPEIFPIISVSTEEGKRFFNKTESNSENGLEHVPSIAITNATGTGGQITYTANNSLLPKDRISVSGMVPAGYNVKDAMVISANETSFTVTGSESGSFVSGGSADIMSSFSSDVLVTYLDKEFTEQVKVFPKILNPLGYPFMYIYLVSENWKNKNVGTEGWIITSSGNAIFNNLAVRGEISATSGNFDGFLTVNNEEMKIGAGVSSSKIYKLSKFEIISNIAVSNQVVVTTVENHGFEVGDEIVVEDIDSDRIMSPEFPEENLIVTEVSGNGENITYTCANSLIPGSIVNITGVSPSSYNLNQVKIDSATSTQFVVSGEIEDAYVSGGLVQVTAIPYEPHDINGKFKITGVTSNTFSYIFVPKNSVIANSSGPHFIVGGYVKSLIENDGIYVNDDNYWYSDGKFSLGTDTKKISFDGTDVTISSDVIIEGGLEAESITLDDYNYWTPTTTGAEFRVGGAASGISWDESTFEIKGDLVTGTIGASAGGINGWNISEGFFASGETTTYVALSASPSNPYSIWAGGEAASTAPFSVKRDGTLNATNAVIEGEITATTIDIGGTDGITYNGTTVTIGSDVTINADVTVQGLRITSETGSSVLTIDNNVSGANDGIYINANNYWYTDGKFSVGNSTKSLVWDNTNLSLTGNIYAVGGTIGGFTIGEDSLTAGTGSTSIGINTTGHPFYAGNAVPESAPFKVTSTGELTATNANITGAITATSGTFTGEVNATSGTISGDFTITGNTKISGSVFVGSSPTTGQRISINGSGIIGIDNSDIVVFNLPAVGNETPTIRNFNALETKITGEGENAYLIAGTTGASATNVIVRGDKTGGQAAAIYSTINGTATSATSGNGFYVDDTGKFRFAQGTNAISGSGGNLSVTGSINATSGYIGGTTSGWLIQSDLLSNSSVGFYAPSVRTGTVSTGATEKVKGSTTLTTTSATIVPKVGMAINNTEVFNGGTYITAVSGSSPLYTITVSSPAKVSYTFKTFTIAEYAMYAGNATRQLAPFKIDYLGNLTASNANITGNINATSGSFTGSIRALDGEIGYPFGWKIDRNRLLGGTYENVGIVSTDNPGIRKNIMQNPSLEKSLAGYVAIGGASISRINTDAYSGSYSLQVTKAAGSGSGVSLYQNSGERYPITPPIIVSSSGNAGESFITVSNSTGIEVGMTVTGVNSYGSEVTGILGNIVAIADPVTTTFSNQNVTFKKLYLISMYVKVPSGNENTTFRLYIDRYTASGTYVNGNGTPAVTVTSSEGWQLLSFFEEAQSLVTSFDFNIKTESTDTAGQKFLIDAVIIEPYYVLKDPRYFDGDTNLFKGYTKARWLGEPGLSESEMSSIAFFAGSNIESLETAPFIVGYDGYLRATNADITGSINATSGHIGGTTSGWSIDSNLLSNDSVGFYAPNVKAGTVTCTSSINEIGSNTFTTLSTTIVPKIGMAIFGSESIPSGTYITNITGNSPTYTITISKPFRFLNANQTFTIAEYAMYAGNATRQLAPFKIDYLGNLTATNADISGRITATSGSFTGAINATSGYIGGSTSGWKIGNSYLVGGAYENVGMLASNTYGIRKNLMQNPSLEKSSVGYVASGAGTSISRVSADAYSGSHCLEVTKSGTAGSGVSLYQNSGERYAIDPPIQIASSGSNLDKFITVSNSTGISVGMSVTGTRIPAGTLVSGVSGTKIALTNPVTATFSAETVTFTKNYWAGAFVRVPTGGETTTLNTFIDYYNSSGSIVSSSSSVAETITVGDGWKFVYIGLTSSSSIESSFVFRINTVSSDPNTAGKKFLVDGSIIEASKNLNFPYFFDGNTRNEGFTARWLGEPGLSESEMSLIAFWAGSSVNTKEAAPFSVGYDGRLNATDANITGNITATSGTIGGFSIPIGDPYRLISSKTDKDSAIKKITLDSTIDSLGVLNRTNIIETTYQSRPDAFGDYSLDSAGIGFTFFNPATITSVAISGTAPNKTIVYTVTDSSYISAGDSVTISDLSGAVASLNIMDVVVSSKTLTTITVTNYNTSIANGTYGSQFGTIGSLKVPYLLADSTYFTSSGDVQGYIFTAITSDVGLEYGSAEGPNIILGKTRNGDVGLSSVSAFDGSPDIMYIQPGGGETNFGGIVTAPSQPAFSVYSLGRSTQSGNLTYNVANSNNGNYMVLGTGLFTAPVSGHYHFNYYAFVEQGLAGNSTISFQKNGSYFPSRAYNDFNDTSYGPVISISAVIYLAAFDNVRVNITGAGVHGNDNSFFSGFLIG